jgi:uncharacterized membrane protein
MTEHALEDETTLRHAYAGDWSRLLSLALAVAGLPISLYLSYVKLGEVPEMTCPAEGATLLGLPIDCGLVDRTRYSMLGPIPVAVLGVAGYLVILLVLALEDRLSLFIADNGRLMLIGLTLFGFAFSAYLTWAEVAQIKTVCSWCLASAVLTTLLFALSLIRLRQGIAKGAV